MFLTSNGILQVTSLKFIASCDEATFLSTVRGETFVTRLTDRTSVELKENGADTPVTLDNRHEYVPLARSRVVPVCSL